MRRSCSIAALGLSATFLAAGPAFAADDVKLETEQSEKYGAYLTDAQGRALYMFEADKQGQGKTRAQSSCYDACAKAWPPLIAEGKPQAGAEVDTSMIDTVERKDGKKQVTYNGWPLYYFVKDKGKGETTGQDVKGFGGEWYLVNAEGQKVGDAAVGGTGTR